MAVDGCGLVCKYIIIIFDCIFAVLGIAFLGFGLWLRFSETSRPIFEIQELNSSAFVIGVTGMIILGAVMLIVVSFGDYGACSEKHCSLQVFSVLVALLAGAEISIGVLAYTYSDGVATWLREFYSSLYMLYVNGGDPAIAVTLTFLHKMLHCCGITGITLGELVKKTCPKPEGILEHLVMNNCLSSIDTVLDARAPLVMGTFIGIGALLIIVFICSVTLTKAIRMTVSSPQYIILSPPTVSSDPLPPEPALTFCSPYSEPVVFTPLTAANIPFSQAYGQ